MKTNIQSKTVAFFVMLLSIIALPQNLAAQCPTINNNTSCDVEVVYHIFDNMGNICFTSALMTIPAGFSFPVPCACTPMGSFVVELRSMSGTAISPIPLIHHPGGSPNSFTPTAGCVSAGRLSTSGFYVVDID